MTAPGRIASENEELAQVDRFLEYFKVEFAVSQRQKDAVYGIRYRVYCEENAYEPAHRFPDRKESDKFDEKALHCLVTHKASGIPAGCARLVSTGGRRQDDSLPFETLCPESIPADFFRVEGLQRESMCEISRLAVDARFRRRPGSYAKPSPASDELGFSSEETGTFPIICTAGFLAATALTEITGREDIFALMEPYLPRLMRRAGFVFQRVGEDVDYHGTRAAYYCKTDWVTRRLRPACHKLYREIHSGLERSYHLHGGWPARGGYQVPSESWRHGHLQLA